MSNDAVVGSIFVILAAALLVALTSCGDGQEVGWGAYDCGKATKKEDIDRECPALDRATPKPSPSPTAEEIHGGNCRAILTYIDADTYVPTVVCEP